MCGITQDVSKETIPAGFLFTLWLKQERLNPIEHDDKIS